MFGKRRKKVKALTLVFKSRALHGGCFETRAPSLFCFEKARQKGWKRVHVSARGRPSLPFLFLLVEEGLQGRGVRVTGRILGLLAGALPQGDGGDGTVGIRDMCVPTHAVVRIHTRKKKKSRVWKEKSTAEGKKRKRERGERRRGRTGPMAVRGRHKARNPWEYRACASGPARVLHELWGGFPPSLSFFFLSFLSHFFLFLVPRDSVTWCIRGDILTTWLGHRRESRGGSPSCSAPANPPS